MTTTVIITYNEHDSCNNTTNDSDGERQNQTEVPEDVQGHRRPEEVGGPRTYTYT